LDALSLDDSTSIAILSGKHLWRFFEGSPQAMWLYDVGTLRFLEVNAAACERYGYTREEFQSMTLLDIRTREEGDKLLRSLADSGLQTGSTPGIWQHRTKAGDVLMIEVLANTIQIGERPVGLAVLRDVTNEHRLKQEAEAQTAQLRRIQDNLLWAQERSHLGSWSLDYATGQFSLSDEYYRITGYEPGGYPPTWPSIIACVHPDDRYLVDKGPSTPSSDTWHPQEIEVRMVRPSGELRYVTSYFDVEFDFQGRPVAMHGTIQDVTERKADEEARTWLAEIVSSSNEAIIGSSLHGLVISWNHAAEILFGYTANEMIGQPLLRLVPPKKWGEAEDILKRLKAGQRIDEFETERIDRNGRIFEASFMISPVRTRQGRMIGAATICRDISIRKDNERQLATRLAQLSALRAIDASITSTAEIGKTLGVVIKQLQATTGVDAACIFIVDEASQAMEVAAQTSEGVSDEQVALARQLAVSVLVNRRPASSGVVAITYLGQDDTLTPGDACDVRPLISKQDVVGVLAVYYRSGIRRPSEQYQFIDAIAKQAAIAIESAALWQSR